MTIGKVLAINEILTPAAAKAPALRGFPNNSDPTDPTEEVTFKIQR